jgi:glutaredoxin-related protein
MSVHEKKIVIVQSNYIPWKGYFDLIRRADVFVLYDDMQYTRRDWRNRNLIKTAQGLQWLTIPVKVKGKYEQRIDETEVSDSSWAESHWKSISNSYRRAAFFTEYSSKIQALYEEASHLKMLSEVNYLFLSRICQFLGIETVIRWSSQFPRVAGRTENLVHLCQSFQASDYISGPSAANYIELEQFIRANIRLQYMTYGNYPEYPQLYGDFEHGVSILDLLFNCGDTSMQFMQPSES